MYAGGGIRNKVDIHYNDPITYSYSQYHEDVRLYRRFFTDPKYIGNGFFVEMGGSNGVTFSNSLIYEYALGWRGIVIEASPINYERIIKQRPCTMNYWTAGI